MESFLWATTDLAAGRAHRLAGSGLAAHCACRGGDAWDQSIRKQIKTCALFLPVISRSTHDRDEGYFRLVWLEAAARLRDGGLVLLKTDPLLDPLRDEARFRAIERALQFP